MWLWSCKNEPWRRDTHLTTHNLLHMDPNDVIFVKDSFSNLTGAVFTYCQPKTSLNFMAWSHFWLKIQFLGWVPTWTSRPALNWVLILPGDQCHPKVQDGGLPRLCSTQLSPLPCGQPPGEGHTFTWAPLSLGQGWLWQVPPHPGGQAASSSPWATGRLLGFLVRWTHPGLLPTGHLLTSPHKPFFSGSKPFVEIIPTV